VQRLAAARSDGQIERQLVQAIRSSLQSNEGSVTPLVDVTVLEE
jgi:hypothetical protein